jgi:hypothetical protein
MGEIKEQLIITNSRNKMVLETHRNVIESLFYENQTWENTYTSYIEIPTRVGEETSILIEDSEENWNAFAENLDKLFEEIENKQAVQIPYNKLIFKHSL